MESKLMKIRCDNCGSEYRISSRGEMNCPYCGSKIYLNDKDFEDYLKTRDEMLIKTKLFNDILNNDKDVLGLWNNTETIMLLMGKDKSPISITYSFYFNVGTTDIYVSKHEIYVLTNDQIFPDYSKLAFPSADIKNLWRYLPRVLSRTELDKYRTMYVISKPESVYPLALFDSLDARHVAWMISRFENLGCLFEFNHMDLTGLDITSFYINPKTHELYYLGGCMSIRTYDTSPTDYLTDIRKIALSIMDKSTAPQECIDFLNQAPASDAYTDFKLWDNVIEHGFNGHNFHKFTSNKGDI